MPEVNYKIMEKDIITKIKEANLLGRGGAGFPVWMKWDAVAKEKGKKVYIIANGSEGEPLISKDKYILEKYPEKFINGIRIALETFPNSEAIIYLNHKYYDKYKNKLEKFSQGFPIKYFRKTAGYLAGEETGLLNHIEGKRVEPRSKPPYPAQSGLYGMPTLVDNIETFYRVWEIADGAYSGKAFFSITGDVKKEGVFEFPENFPVRKILEETGNWPAFDFFIQYGGGAAGAIYLPEELEEPKKGATSIIVFNRQKTDALKLMKSWAKFYSKENCDKCTPCRESSIRILEMIKENKLDFDKLNDMFFVLEKTSFCPLGKGMATPYKTLIEKVLKQK